MFYDQYPYLDSSKTVRLKDIISCCEIGTTGRRERELTIRPKINRYIQTINLKNRSHRLPAADILALNRGRIGKYVFFPYVSTPVYHEIEEVPDNKLCVARPVFVNAVIYILVEWRFNADDGPSA